MVRLGFLASRRVPKGRIPGKPLSDDLLLVNLWGTQLQCLFVEICSSDIKGLLGHRARNKKKTIFKEIYSWHSIKCIPVFTWTCVRKVILLVQDSQFQTSFKESTRLLRKRSRQKVKQWNNYTLSHLNNNVWLKERLYQQLNASKHII